MTDEVLYIGHVSHNKKDGENTATAYRMRTGYAEETADMLVNIEAREEAPAVAAAVADTPGYTVEEYRARLDAAERTVVSTELEVSEGDILNPDALEPGGL